MAARELVARLRRRLRDVFHAHGAVHAQLGRFYRHDGALDASAVALARRVKAALDPRGLMNPGALDL